jgi:hypothetical protein
MLDRDRRADRRRLLGHQRRPDGRRELLMHPTMQGLAATAG